MTDKNVKFGIGSIVKHRLYPFRGVVFDVDPEFDNTDEWYEAIPAELRQTKRNLFTICLPKIQTAITPPMSASKICSLMEKTAR